MVRTLAFVAAVQLLALPAAAQFAAYEWTLVQVGEVPGSGSVTGDTLTVIGPNGQSPTGGSDTYLETIAPFSGVYRCAMSWDNQDNELGYDFAAYYLNGERVIVATIDDSFQVDFFAAAGDAFGFGVYAKDSCCGPGVISFEGLSVSPGSCAQVELEGSRPSNGFGLDVDMDGDRVIVGDEAEARAYVFIRDGTEWMLEAELLDPADTKFGRAVSLSGNRALIAGQNTVHVLRLDEEGWTVEATLAPSAGAPSGFGRALDFSGHTALIGSPNEGSNSGAAWVFQRTDEGWIEEAKLTAGGVSSGARFGSSVSVEGDLALVGAPHADVFSSSSYWSSTSPGAAFVFRRTSSGWIEEAKLATGAYTGGKIDQDAFGADVDLDGRTAIVGAPAMDAPSSHNQYANAGAAFVFREGDSGWEREAKLVASTPSKPEKTVKGYFSPAPDQFGYSVSLAGDFAVIGSPGDDDVFSGSGAAYLFERARRVWHERSKLNADFGTSHRRYGSAVATDGEHLIVGQRGGAFVLPRTFPACQILESNVATLSATRGGTQWFSLAAGSAHAGKPYILLGSATTSWHGVPVDGVLLPLAFDAYTLFTVLNAGGPALPGSVGFLNGDGFSVANLDLPPLSASLAGTTLHHAGLIFELDGMASLASNRVSLTLSR